MSDVIMMIDSSSAQAYEPLPTTVYGLMETFHPDYSRQKKKKRVIPVINCLFRWFINDSVYKNICPSVCHIKNTGKNISKCFFFFKCFKQLSSSAAQLSQMNKLTIPRAHTAKPPLHTHLNSYTDSLHIYMHVDIS